MLKYNILNDIVPRNGFGSHASRLHGVFHSRRKIYLHIHIDVEVKVDAYIHLVLLISLLKLIGHIGLHSVYRVIDKNKVYGQLKFIV